MFLGRDVLKACIKFTGENPYRSVISIMLPWNFTEIAFRHECFPVNLQQIGSANRFPCYKPKDIPSS